MDAMNMPVSSTPKNKFTSLLKQVKHDFPDVRFEAADSFYWSAETRSIHYNTSSENPTWSLLHELGHMTQEHTTYNSDARLVRMEVEAWETALVIGKQYGYTIDEEHVQDCLDSYRHWQHTRSRCPICTQSGLEVQSGHYRCINCQHRWQVTVNRFCRVYRQTKKPS